MHVLICLCLSILSCISYKFAKVKVPLNSSTSIDIGGVQSSPEMTVSQKYSLFIYHDSVLFDSNDDRNNDDDDNDYKDRCYFYYDWDNFDKTNSFKTAQGMAILMVFMLISLVACVATVRE